jgi:putative transposase
MARLNRLAVADVVHHVVHRAAEHQRVFVDAADRAYFRDALLRSLAEYAVSLHAYVLLDDEVQLLLTPTTAPRLSQMMQALSRFYVPGFNRRHTRTGALWQGRFRAAPVGGGESLLACMLYVEQAPVRRGLSAKAIEFEHSSARHHAGRMRDPILARVPTESNYWMLGNTPFDRDAAYLRLLEQPMDQTQLALIESSTLYGWPLGPDEFMAQLTRSTGRRLASRSKGRPRNATGL